MTDLIITAPNGVRWKRAPEGTSSGSELIAALEDLRSLSSIDKQWNWWQEGREKKERERAWNVLNDWDHADPPPGGYITMEEYEARRADREAKRKKEKQERASAYEKDRDHSRILLLSEEATTGFMKNVLASPASRKQREKAESLLEASEQKSAELRRKVGDPDIITDERGDLPPERRERNLYSHMCYFRHELLRRWSSGQRHRFNQLISMPPPKPQEMCPECQAPREWHSYGVSLCLWRERPEPGSPGSQIASMIPGFWERCSACTNYQLIHKWGGHGALPDFDADQWRSMLTPLLRAIFAPDKPEPRKKKENKKDTLERRLKMAEAEAERLRRELAKEKGGEE